MSYSLQRADALASHDSQTSRGLISAFLVAVSLSVFVRTAWVGDDAFITLRTVDNFVHGYGLRWNVVERVQAFTHPLWMMLLTVVYSITREPYFTAIALSIALSVTAVVLIVRHAPGTSAAAWAVAALVGSKAFVDYSTSGLENPLTHVLLVLFWLAWRSDRSRNATAVWLLAALLWLNRFDLALLVLPALAVRLRDLRDHPKAVAAALSLSAGWALFALCYYGTVLPNTAYAKLQTGVSEFELVKQGLLYTLNSLSLDPLTLTVVFIGLIVSFGAPRREWAAAAGMILYLAYIVAIGGDFMSGRMFTPVFITAVMQLLACRRDGPPVWVAATVITIALGLVGPRPPMLFDARDTFPEQDLIEATGIADERLIYHQQGMGLLVTVRNSGARHPFIKLGIDARSGPRVVPALTIGMMGYYAGPGVHIVDVLALSEPLLARLPAVPGWRIGHYVRALPDGYMETLATGRNTIRDARVAALYEKMTLITRGPVWDTKRLRAIVAINSGGYDTLMEAAIP